MKWLNGSKISLVLVGFVAAVVLGGQSASADFTFGTPTNLGPTVNSTAKDGTLSTSADGLSGYFDSTRSGGSGREDIYVTTRASVSEPWGEAVNLGPTVNSSGSDWAPCISHDGLSLYFTSWGEKFDIWVTTRETTADDWAA
ncbi:MAG: hypothetical protein ACE5NM_13775 [Sedimentisphaerales bacterium]